MLNPDTAAEMQREIAQRERQIRRMQEDAELEFNRQQNESLSRVSEKIQAVISEYAEQNGFGAVFLQGPSLPYFAPALDITATIIRIYDEKHPVAAPKAGTAGSTSPNP
jgi:Skp family chaperone for outer membrane proteins